MSLRVIEEKIDKLQECTTRMEVHVERNTDDLSIHIKRTNILEGKLQKIIYLLMIGAGVGIALYGPQFFKLIGIFI